MDEVDVDDVSAVGASENNQIQGKEADLLLKVDRHNVLERQEINIAREGNYPKSSIQEFMDLLGGTNLDRDLHFGEKSDHLYSSAVEGAEDRVQELTLLNHTAVVTFRNANEQAETLRNDLSHVYQLSGEQEVRTTNGHNSCKGKEHATSNQPETEGCISLAEGLDQQSYDYIQTSAAGQAPGRERETQKAFLFGGVRTKMLSKTGFSEYFVKNNLKGKGIVYRGQPSPAPHVELTSEKKIGTAVAPPVDSNDALPHLGPTPTLPSSSNATKPRPASRAQCMRGSRMKIAGPVMNYVDAPISTSPQLDLTPSLCAVKPGFCGTDSGCGEGSLRAWLKSRDGNVHKLVSLRIFRKILDVADSFHVNGKALLDLRPSCFNLIASNEVKYTGRLSDHMVAHKSLMLEDTSSIPMPKRPREQAIHSSTSAKQQKRDEDATTFTTMPWFQPRHCLKSATVNAVGMDVVSGLSTSHEERWYGSPEEHSGMGCTTSSNIYSLGMLLFELLSCFDNEKARASAMSDLRQRILPPNFLSGNPKEAGFCLWLLHPEPSLRPTTRDVLQSEVVSGFQKMCEDDLTPSSHEDDTESETLLQFLQSVKEKKQKDASKLTEEISCIEADLSEAKSRRYLRNSLISSYSHQDTPDIRENILPSRDAIPYLVPGKDHSVLFSNISQLEKAYFSARSQIPLIEQEIEIRPDINLLRNHEQSSLLLRAEGSHVQLDPVGDFFDGLCKYARYKKLEVCGAIRTGDLTNSANVIFSLSFDRDEEYFAAAGVSKKVKIYEYQALCDESVDIHYPVAEMSNESRLSCICWNTYIHNYLASTDYTGAVKLWDTSTGQEIFKYTEHEKRAWSVDFSRLDPTNLASGSDDFSVRLWSINQRSSLCSIRNAANVCCVQFSPYSSNLLAFGSADYKIYCYDIRNTNVPWCTLGGHDKAVSYVKFLDSETLVSASTDNTLKLWDLRNSSDDGFSTKACKLTFKGHSNEKNFVGLSVANGYIACGSETNEVFTYHRSLPVPVATHKFGSTNPVTGKHTHDANGQFVSSVCCRSKSPNIVAANSSGRIKVLRMI